MYKIIGGDGKEYGPVSAEELRHWIAEGRLNAQSWVRLDTATEWKALGTFPEFGEMLANQRAAASPRLALAPPPGRSGSASEELLGTKRYIAVGSCLRRSFELLKANFGLLFVAVFAIWIIGFISALVPFHVGQAVYFMVKGVLYGGLYIVFLKRIRGEAASPADVFSGFAGNPIQLILVGVITGLLIMIATTPCCLILPGIYLAIAWVFAIPLVADRGLEFWSAMEISRKAVTRVWFEVFALVLLAFLGFILANIVVITKVMMTTWPMIQEVLRSGQPDVNQITNLIHRIQSQQAKEGGVAMIVLQCIWLLNWPFALGALMYAYEDLFGARKSAGA